MGTADLLDMIVQEEPGTEFTFCLGSDTLIDLLDRKWKRSEDVLALRRFVVIIREGVQHPVEERIVQEPRLTVKLLRVSALDAVSSTMIRSCQDETTLRSLLAPAVFDYTKEKKMYAFADTS